MAQTVKNLPAVQETQVRSLGRKDPQEESRTVHLSVLPWRSEWLPTPVFLPGESHGQRSLAGYSPQGLKESDMTEVT